METVDDEMCMCGIHSSRLGVGAEGSVIWKEQAIIRGVGSQCVFIYQTSGSGTYVNARLRRRWEMKCTANSFGYRLNSAAAR